RVAAVYVLKSNFAAHASMSYGFSPPTAWEIFNPDGTINKDLKAERGVNYETGIRGSVLEGKISFDATVYQMDLTNAILTRVTPGGKESYQNAGSTDQKGLEILIS